MAELPVSYHSSVPWIPKSYYVIDQEAQAGCSDILACFHHSTIFGLIWNVNISCLIFGHQTQQQEKH